MFGTRPFEVIKNIQVASYDIDMAGIVSNIVYIRWLEDLRVELFTKLVPFQELVESGLMPALVKTNIDYKRSIRMFEPVTACMWLEKIGTTSVTIGAEIRVGDTLSAAATQVGVFIHSETGRAAAVPREIVTKFNDWVINHPQRGL